MATFAECALSNREWQHSAIDRLKDARAFGDAPLPELTCFVAEAAELRLPAKSVIVDEHERFDSFLVLLEGKVRVSRSDANGQYFFNKTMSGAAFMGEVPLLSNLPSYMRVEAETEVRGLRLDAQGFWNVMARCPEIRATILAETMLRMRGQQQQQTQQEKLAMLGTMTAGLMHELNNPGAAAGRAASQLRANLERMHHLARSFSERGHTPEQRACLSALQERALSVRADFCLSSVQQSDAEEVMGAWMDGHAVAHAWEFAPVLVSSGIGPADLQCLAGVFSFDQLSEPIEWLEATASSMQMVGLVEDSVTRVTELAQAVKSYAHEGQGGVQDMDVNESVHATVVMLKHKFREKNIRLEKSFGTGLPKLHCICSGLNQVWTNLLDNAIDAVPVGGRICLRTTMEANEVQVAIEDNGQGISPADQEHIFDPFFTTKAAGVGTGLGLGIVRKILEGYEGRLTLQSAPGRTEFVVHIPLRQGE